MQCEYPDDDEFEDLLRQEAEMRNEIETEYYPDDDELGEPGSTVTPAATVSATKRSLNFGESMQGSQLRSSMLGALDAIQFNEQSDPRNKNEKEFVTNGSLLDQFNTERCKKRSADLDHFIENPDIKKSKRMCPQVPMISHSSEVKCNSDEADFMIIDCIIKRRQNIQDQLRAQTSAPTSSLGVSRTHNCQKVFRRIPQSAFQTVTTDSGGRFYLTLMEEDDWLKEVANAVSVHRSELKLLAMPYATLKEQAVRQDVRFAASLQNQELSLKSRISKDESNKEELWVEKYKPRCYLDLLSCETVNRAVLKWIKLWDKLVFGLAIRQQNEKMTDDKKVYSTYNPQVIEELDEQGRPIQKVILLCGPPGLGKTTLAHIIARHAGYNVVELNASDDRSVEVFHSQLETATSMRSVLGDHRPNCLVIDEIDGAPAPSINWLVNLLTGKDTGGKKKTGKKKERSTFLHRPVLCICNDLYAPALRPLKQIALVVQFQSTESRQLAQRLFSISRQQHLRADLSILLALCDKTENDIRSCLSVLQFAQNSHNSLTLRDIEGAAIGQKDYKRSLFNVWKEMFHIPETTMKRRANPHELKHTNGILDELPDDSNDDTLPVPNSLGARFSRMLHASQACGEYDRLTQGWFENYLTLKLKHINMEPIVDGLDWASFVDVVNQEILHMQSWNLMAYLPYTCVFFHLQFATHDQPKIQFPHQMSELMVNMHKLQSILTAMVGELNPLTRSFNPTNVLVLDMLPYLSHIIRPNLKTVNTKLITDKEKKEMMNVRDTMIAYNLMYQQTPTPDGKYDLKLDPDFEEVIRFSDFKPSNPHNLECAVRLLLSQEIALEKMRLSEKYFSDKLENNNNRLKSTSAIDAPRQHEGTTTNRTSLPNHLQRLEAKPIVRLELNKVEDSRSVSGTRVAPRDFFGRVIPTQQMTAAASEAATNEIIRSDIWFKFKEGYSNAVRRTIKMKDLV